MFKTIYSIIILLSVNSVFAETALDIALEETAVDQIKVESESRFDKILDDVRLSASVSVLDVDLLDGLSIGLKYKYKVEKSLRDNYFTRLDRWRLNADIQPGSLLDDLPIYLKLDDEAEIVFAQQFTDGTEARKLNNGYLPKMLPLNAEKALNLKTGDYARFEARMNLVAGAGQTFPINSVLEVRANAYYLMGGNYQVHVFRLADEKVRIRLVGLRQKRKGANFRFGMNKGVDILGMEVLDKAIIRNLDLDEMIAYEGFQSNDNLFMLDYTLDLSVPEVYQAYNDVFSSAKKFRSIEVANPTSSTEEIKDKLIGNVAVLEDLAREQMLIKNEESRSVTRNFKASNISESVVRKSRWGIKLVERERSNVYRKNFLTQVELNENGEDEHKYFIYPTWTKRSEFEFLFGWFEIDVRQSSNAIFIANEEGDPILFKSIGFNRESRQTDYDKRNHVNVMEHLSTLLPQQEIAALNAKLDTAGYLKVLEGKDLEDVVVNVDYFLNQNAYLAVMDLLQKHEGASDIKDYIERTLILHLTNMAIEGKYPNKFINVRKGDSWKEVNLKIVENDSRKIQSVRDKLTKALTPCEGLDQAQASYALLSQGRSRLIDLIRDIKVDEEYVSCNNQRLDAFAELRKSSLFRAAGTSYLLSLVERAGVRMDQSLHLTATFRSRKMDTVSHTYGVGADREFYELVSIIDTILNDRSDDIAELARIQKMLENTQIIQN